MNIATDTEERIEVTLDDATALAAPALPQTPGLQERLRALESERQAAFSQMHRMAADLGALKQGRDRWRQEMAQVQGDALFRLALIAEYRAGGTSGKVLRMGVMSAMLAHAMACDEEFCERLQMAAPLLDIGEIGLPDSLFASAALSDIERELMRSHCRLGHALLADSASPEINLAATIALGHHEHFNGSGYPGRLSGQGIPLACRIVAVIDCFDALTQNRPFRDAHTLANAAEMVMAGSGVQFDPAVIEAFRRISEALLLVRWLLDEASPHPEGRRWLGRAPEPGLWRRFL
jgi:response regulator RpfG family c-di-GMP phosphodiesterase